VSVTQAARLFEVQNPFTAEREIYMTKRILTLLVASSLALTACMETTGQKQTIGGVSGAVIGGVLGSQVGDGKGQLVAVGVGTLLGALAGSSIGQSLDRADMMYANRANQRAYSAPIGETISWSNPDSGNSGTVTPVREGKSTSGRYCREYSQTIYVDGRKETGYGTACRNPDGSWQIVN
jgi:surface antigen